MSFESETPRRGLTKFLCQELLFDYVAGLLDSRREQEVTKFLKTCGESQRELEKIKRALSYTYAVKELKINPRLHSALLHFEPSWQKALRNTTEQFAAQGWRWMPYLVIAATVILGTIAIKPWQIRQPEDAILAEQLKKEPYMLPPQAVPSTSLAANLNSVAQSTETISLSPVAPLKVTSESETAKSPTADAAPAKNEKPPAVGARGFLMRGEMEVSDFHNVWPAIRDKVLALGGKTAGNVELGWLKTPTQSYFHFLLPESNYPELELFLGTFSPVRFSNERHPRVMPQGKIRIILTVKEGVGNEGSAEAP